MVDITESPTNLIPRGTDRVRRRAKQAEAVVISEKEIAELVSPSGPEKVAAIEAAQTRDKLRFTDNPKGKIRKVLQAEHRVLADAEAAAVAAAPPTPLAVFRPGQQVDHRTARAFMKANSRRERDVALEAAKGAAKAAGNAVLDTLKGQRPATVTRHRKRAQHAAKVAAATKTE
jgi:hypothetical protein